MKEYKKEFPGIGEILFEKSKKAKRLNITVRPSRGIRVAVPRGCTFKTAEKFTMANLEWIRQKTCAQSQRTDRQQKVDIPNIPRKEAREILIKRLEKLSEATGLSYNRVFIKNQKTLWGSCSSRKNINLNIKLLSLPKHLMDYVILHELVHTRILNHSKLFWDSLEKLLPDCKKMRKELHQYSPQAE